MKRTIFLTLAGLFCLLYSNAADAQREQKALETYARAEALADSGALQLAVREYREAASLYMQAARKEQDTLQARRTYNKMLAALNRAAELSYPEAPPGETISGLAPYITPRLLAYVDASRELMVACNWLSSAYADDGDEEKSYEYAQLVDAMQNRYGTPEAGAPEAYGLSPEHRGAVDIAKPSRVSLRDDRVVFKLENGDKVERLPNRLWVSYAFPAYRGKKKLKYVFDMTISELGNVTRLEMKRAPGGKRREQFNKAVYSAVHKWQFSSVKEPGDQQVRVYLTLQDFSEE